MTTFAQKVERGFSFWYCMGRWERENPGKRKGREPVFRPPSPGRSGTERVQFRMTRLYGFQPLENGRDHSIIFHSVHNLHRSNFEGQS